MTASSLARVKSELGAPWSRTGRPGRSTIPLPQIPLSAPASTGPAIGPDGLYTEIQVFGDGTRHLVPIRDVVEGGPDKDGIPSIDAPKFLSVSSVAPDYYRQDGWIIGVKVGGRRRAYPFQVLVWHEIVDDQFDGLPLLVTYCPLCGSGIAFERRLETGEVVEFGVTGRLYNSGMLLYDRKTDSVWTQITGTAVIGELTGQRLKVYPSELMTWGEWRNAYPDSDVLSRETGYPRDYDTRPYGPYDQTITVAFPVSGRDDRMHPKTRVSGLRANAETFAAYPDEAVRLYGPVNDIVDSIALLLVADPGAGGNVRAFERSVGGLDLTFSQVARLLRDRTTGSDWNFDGHCIGGAMAGRQFRERVTLKLFWFAWYAFHQDTLLWLPEGWSSGPTVP